MHVRDIFPDTCKRLKKEAAFVHVTSMLSALEESYYHLHISSACSGQVMREDMHCGTERGDWEEG